MIKLYNAPSVSIYHVKGLIFPAECLNKSKEEEKPGTQLKQASLINALHRF